MGKLVVNCFSGSVGGFGAGPNQDLQNPLGVGGMALHDWFFSTRTFQKVHGTGGGTTGIDGDFAARGFAGIGASILGRNRFGPVRGPWPDEAWKGRWRENPPYHTPVFVLICLLVAASACGDRTAVDEATSLPRHSGVDAFDASEAGFVPPIDAAFNSGVACGPMECARGSICVTTLEGAGPCLPPSDGGVCPFGNMPFNKCCVYAAYACQSGPFECTSNNVCGCTQLCPFGSCDAGEPLSPLLICNEIGT